MEGPHWETSAHSPAFICGVKRAQDAGGSGDDASGMRQTALALPRCLGCGATPPPGAKYYSLPTGQGRRESQQHCQPTWTPSSSRSLAREIHWKLGCEVKQSDSFLPAHTRDGHMSWGMRHRDALEPPTVGTLHRLTVPPPRRPRAPRHAKVLFRLFEDV